VFTLWKDQITKGRNRLFWDDYAEKKRPGADDQKRILEIVIEKQIPAYGLICTAKDTSAKPRSIRSINAEYLIKLRIEKDGEGVYGRHLKKVYLIDLIKELKDSQNQGDGVDDLGTPPEGTDTPDRAKVCGWVVVRDPEVRAYVILKANGSCEYCGKVGFSLKSGGHYVEAHHIIALAKQGRVRWTPLSRPENGFN
jgi:5-methylcytosine-specific restriction protein A